MGIRAAQPTMNNDQSCCACAELDTLVIYVLLHLHLYESQGALARFQTFDNLEITHPPEPKQFSHVTSSTSQRSRRVRLRASEESEN